MARDYLLALLDLPLALVTVFLLGVGELVVVPRVDANRLVVDVHDVGRDVVEEAMVMGDHQRAALEIAEKTLEPADRHDVEVVGRLVEQQHLRPRGQHLGQQHPQLEAARKRRERCQVADGGDAQTLEDLAGAGLEAVAVLPHDDVLELRVAIAVELLAGVGQQDLLLAHRLPQL